MAVNHILLDLDGVLCDFFKGALDLFGFDVSNYPAEEYDIEKVVGVSATQFWKRVTETEDFWVNLKPYPWADGLLATIESLGIPWTIATAPSFDPYCVKQKVEWMRKHIHPHFTSYMMGKQKHLMAKPDVLLIDDSDRNVGPFIAAGGQAILFPARWNSLHYVDDPYGYVKSALMELTKEDPANA